MIEIAMENRVIRTGNCVIATVADHVPEAGTVTRTGSENVTATIGGAAGAGRKIAEGVADLGVVTVDARGNVSAMIEVIAVPRIARTENAKPVNSRTAATITKVLNLLRALSNR